MRSPKLSIYSHGVHHVRWVGGKLNSGRVGPTGNLLHHFQNGYEHGYVKRKRKSEGKVEVNQEG